MENKGEINKFYEKFIKLREVKRMAKILYIFPKDYYVGKKESEKFTKKLKNSKKKRKNAVK